MSRQRRLASLPSLVAAVVACSLSPAHAQSTAFSQQGPKLSSVGGQSVALSADGNTAIIGNPKDNSGAGSAAVYTRTSGVWTQQTRLLRAVRFPQSAVKDLLILDNGDHTP